MYVSAITSELTCKFIFVLMHSFF